jgi:hypothetical protein
MELVKLLTARLRSTLRADTGPSRRRCCRRNRAGALRHRDSVDPRRRAARRLQPRQRHGLQCALQRHHAARVGATPRWGGGVSARLLLPQGGGPGNTRELHAAISVRGESGDLGNSSVASVPACRSAKTPRCSGWSWTPTPRPACPLGCCFLKAGNQATIEKYMRPCPDFFTGTTRFVPVEPPAGTASCNLTLIP